MALTQLQIEHAKPKEKTYRLADGDGLRLDIMPTGGKLWRWRYSYNGKAQLMSLGKYPIVGLKEARRLRDENRSLLAQGKHPVRERKAQKIRNMHEGENTFEVISRKWLSLKQGQLNKKYHGQCLARMEQHVFPLIGSLPITEITIPDVVNVLEKIAATGTVETARRMKQLVS